MDDADLTRCGVKTAQPVTNEVWVIFLLIFITIPIELLAFRWPIISSD